MISVDTSLDLGATAGTSLTVSYTNNGNILFVGAFATGGNNITGVTYNGVALTQIPTASPVQVPSNLWISLWYLIAPATGAHDIVISASPSTTIGGDAVSYIATTPNIDVSGNATATAASSISKSITTTKNNAWTLGWCSTDGFNVSAGASTTLRIGNSGNRAIFDSNGGITPAGSTTLNVSQAGSGNSAFIMTSFYDVAPSVSGSFAFL